MGLTLPTPARVEKQDRATQRTAREHRERRVTKQRRDRACSLLHPTRHQAPRLLFLASSAFPDPSDLGELRGVGQDHTRMDGLVAGEVALVAEGGLAAVTLVGFVTVGLQRVPLEGGLLREAAVTLIAEEGPILCRGGGGHQRQPEGGWAPRPPHLCIYPCPRAPVHPTYMGAPSKGPVGISFSSAFTVSVTRENGDRSEY